MFMLFSFFEWRLRRKLTMMRRCWQCCNEQRSHLHWKKNIFSIAKFSYLGDVARPKCLENAVHTSGAIQKLKQLHITTELLPFLERCTTSRRIAPNSARIAAHLNQFLLKDQPTKFGPLNERGVIEIKTIPKKFLFSHSSVAVSG